MAAEVAEAVVTLMPSFKGGQAAIGRELSGITRGAGKRAGGESGKAFGGAFLTPLKGLAGPIGAVFAAVGVGQFLTSAISQASDLNETVSKTKVVFGPAAQAVLKYADNANTGLGQTRQQALDAAATFGTFGKSAGLQGKALSGFSTEMVGLAADMASFSNTTPDQAIDALGAALRGETEPIRAYGVLLDDASLRQEAVRQGLIKTTKTALTPQQKVLAAHALILKQTTDAQGDFGRTSGGLANQQRILSAQWSDLKTNLGTAFLPVITQVVQAFNGLLPNLKSVGDVVGKTLGPAFSQIAPLAKAFINGLSGGSAGGSGPLVTVTNAAGKLRTAFSGLMSILGTLIPPVKAFFGDLKAAAAVILPPLLKFFAALGPPLQKIGTQIVAVVGPALRSIGQIIRTQVAPALAAFLPAVAPIAAFLIGVIGGSVVGALKGAVSVIKGVFTILAGVLNIFAALFTGDWGRLWQGVKQVFSGLWSVIVGAFKIFINVGLGKVFKLGASLLGKIASGLFGKLGGLFERGMLQLAFLVGKGIGAVVRFFRGLPGKALSALSSLGSKIASLAARAFFAMGTAIRSGVSTAVGYVKGLPGKALSALGNLSGRLKDAGRRLIQGFIDGIKAMISKVKNAAGDVMDAVGRFLPGSPAKEGPLSGKGWSLYAGQHLVEDLSRGMAQRAGGAQDALSGALAIPRPRVAGMSAGSSGLTGGDTHVTVILDGEPIRAVVRTEIGESNRSVRNRVLAGVGGAA